MKNYNEINVNWRAPIKLWTKGVPVEDDALIQLGWLASMPFIHSHIAVMPDVHVGKGATVGTVLATRCAIIPSAVGVDIGCGMEAIKLDVKANQLPDNLKVVRLAIEEAVPHGFSSSAKGHVKGSWAENVELSTQTGRLWREQLQADYQTIMSKHKKLKASNDNSMLQLGTLGGGNHFIELCIDENDNVWIMLHSGSRGIGNKIGTYFIERAREAMGDKAKQLPDKDLAYINDSDRLFDDYWFALDWAQRYAAINRKLMLENVITAINRHIPIFAKSRKLDKAISCHHNYASREQHFGDWSYVTRKGAVSAKEGELGIIPGSMGAKSYIVRGKGNPESFCSCSHGAGRKLSRGAAKRQFDTADLVRATQGVECRKDADVIDEIPDAYKDIDAVMNAQSDLVEIVSTLKQVLCVKG